MIKLFSVHQINKISLKIPVRVPRFPNIEPFNGSFLKAASTDDEMVKISKITNVRDKTDFIDNIMKSLGVFDFLSEVFKLKNLLLN